MSKRAVLYARVSDPVLQDREDKVSINEQLADMRALCERNGWEVVGEFVDNKTYRATQSPRKGKIVNPSGERADRPEFLRMLEVVKTGQVDVVLCWRDDRLVRHPRVAVALEDALDIGDSRRNGRPPIEVMDATGAVIDRFTLQVKATVWREENKRRAERTRMGKEATLRAGRWPGQYRRWGYKCVKEPGKRGQKIVIDPETAPIVLKIYEMYDAGYSVAEIRQWLIENRVPQIYTMLQKHEWSMPLISRILRREEYLGRATWRFKDGTTITVPIPQIVPTDLFYRVQAKIERNKQRATRNAKGIYLLQGLARCGECGNGLSVSRNRNFKEGYRYRCHTASHNAHEGHPQPHSFNGPALDWAVWRHLVDYGIKRPDLIAEQIEARLAELRTQREELKDEIAHARARLASIADERAFYQRQAARGKITEAEFDARMSETEEELRYWESELGRLLERLAQAERGQAGIDYATEFLSALQEGLAEIDQPPDELASLPEARRREVLETRRKIVRALVDRVWVYADHRVIIEGVLDGSEGIQFELPWSTYQLSPGS